MCNFYLQYLQCMHLIGKIASTDDKKVVYQVFEKPYFQKWQSKIHKQNIKL